MEEDDKVTKISSNAFKRFIDITCDKYILDRSFGRFSLQSQSRDCYFICKFVEKYITDEQMVALTALVEKIVISKTIINKIEKEFIASMKNRSYKFENFTSDAIGSLAKMRAQRDFDEIMRTVRENSTSKGVL